MTNDTPQLALARRAAAETAARAEEARSAADAAVAEVKRLEDEAARPKTPGEKVVEWLNIGGPFVMLLNSNARLAAKIDEIIDSALAEAKPAAAPQPVTYRVIAGPVWRDACEHESDEYVGSFKQTDGSKHDVYVFTNAGHSPERPGVCVRWGDEGSNYYSPGDLNGSFRDFAKDIPHYAAAADLIDAWRARPRAATPQPVGAEIETPEAVAERMVIDDARHPNHPGCGKIRNPDATGFWMPIPRKTCEYARHYIACAIETRDSAWGIIMRRAVADELEACAAEADSWATDPRSDSTTALQIGRAIRARKVAP